MTNSKPLLAAWFVLVAGLLAAIVYFVLQSQVGPTTPIPSATSPSPRTQSGQKVLAGDPNSPGSLGIAISEAVEDAATHDDAHYSLGSVLNHVLLHQSVIGQEALKQMDAAGEYPDVVIGCVGGGSNFAGLAFPFVGEKLRQGKRTRIVAVEPEACPTLTKGTYAYDFGDTVGLTRAWWRRPPIRKMACSMRRFSSLARRASSRRPSRRTPFGRPSTRPCGRARRVNGE